MFGHICRRCSLLSKSLPHGRNMQFRPITCSRPRNRPFLWKHLQPTVECKKICSEHILTRKSDLCANHIRYCSATTNKKSANIEEMYELGYIYVKTSNDRWHEFPEGVEFDAGFVDSMPDAPSDSKVPVILGLPSSIGSYKDLTKVLSVFVKSGCRVIIPNMPGSKGCLCRTRSETIVFMNTADEKAEFLADFLSEVDVDKVDMVVSDSDSVYTAVNLCNQKTNMVNSLAMINPTGLTYTKYTQPVLLFRNINLMWEEVFFMQPIIWFLLAFFKVFTRKWDTLLGVALGKQYMQPVLLFRNINLMWEEVFFMQPIIWFLLAFFKVHAASAAVPQHQLDVGGGVLHTARNLYMQPVLLFRNINLMWEEVFFMQPIIWFLLAFLKVFTRKRHLGVSELVTLSKTIRNCNFEEISEELENYASLKHPSMALYTEDSERLTQQSTEELLALMGIPPDNITTYDDNDEMITPGSIEGNKWAVLFRGNVGDIKETKAKLIRTKLLGFHKSVKPTKT